MPISTNTQAAESLPLHHIKMELIRIMSFVAISASVTAALNLNITAIGASNGSSTLECWQLEEPFFVSTIPGVTGSASALLGDTANITVTVLPAAFDGGWHNAPLNQSVTARFLTY